MATRISGDVVFSWRGDPSVEDGYNIYGTDDKLVLGAPPVGTGPLRASAGHAPGVGSGG